MAGDSLEKEEINFAYISVISWQENVSCTVAIFNYRQANGRKIAQERIILLSTHIDKITGFFVPKI